MQVCYLPCHVLTVRKLRLYTVTLQISWLRPNLLDLEDFPANQASESRVQHTFSTIAFVIIKIQSIEALSRMVDFVVLWSSQTRLKQYKAGVCSNSLTFILAQGFCDSHSLSIHKSNASGPHC